MLNDQVVSYIRTWVPALVGLVAGWAVSVGLPVTQGMQNVLTPVLSAAFIGLYYAGVRYAEKRWPAAGWLLGVPKTPAYGTEDRGANVPPHPPTVPVEVIPRNETPGTV